MFPTMRSIPKFASALAIFFIAVIPGMAQWAHQTITLQPGWNAVFLEVAPEPADCDSIFANLPVESVWKWNKTFSPVQFIQNPDELLPGAADWLNYLPPSQPAREAINLHILQGGNAYLIKLRSGASATTWQITGRPSIRPVEWLAGSFNLVGFHLAPGAGPTAQSFFAGVPAHAGQPIYRLNAAGVWSVLAPNSVLRSGEAYWAYANGPSTFNGPLEIVLDQGTGLDYGRVLIEQNLRVRNASGGTAALVLRQLPSEASPSTTPPLAGPVPLAYFIIDAAAQTNRVRWDPLPASMTKAGVSNGAAWSLRLEARRRDMPPFTSPTGSDHPLYQSLLEVTDGRGSRFLVGVSSEGLQAARHSQAGLTAGGAGGGGLQTVHPRAGLWIGTVELDQINQPANASDSATPFLTAAPFSFRIIVHVNESGQAQLLQNVIQLWKKGTPGDTNQPGQFVLFSGDAGKQLVAQYADRLTGSTFRNGQFAGRRLSSAAFSFSNPLPLSGVGDFGNTDSTLGGVVIVGYDDSLNPYKHRFHPDHDNLDDRYERLVDPLDGEAFAINRSLTLRFAATDPESNATPGWGDTLLGGNYQETITGIHKDRVIVSGTFRLNYSCNVTVLNPSL